MSERGSYFTPEFFGFFRALRKNNNKEWFTANKERYEAVVQEPAVRFIRDAGARLQKITPYLVADARPFGGSLSRIYQDIRFSPDKGPYKTHIGIHFWHAKASPPEHMTPGYFLHVEPGESGVRRLAPGTACAQENPRSNRRGAEHLEKSPPGQDPARGRVAQTTSARLRSEPSVDRRPAAEGLRRNARVPRLRSR